MNLAPQLILSGVGIVLWLSLGIGIFWFWYLVLILQAGFFFTMQMNLLSAAYLLLYSKNYVDNPAAPSVGFTEVGMRVEGV